MMYLNKKTTFTSLLVWGLGCTFALSALSGCNHPKENTDITTCDTIPLAQGGGDFSPLANKSVVYLDISTSTAGYLNTTSDPTFNGVVSEMCYLLPGETTAALYGTKIEYLSTDSLLECINNRKIKWADESDLPSMIESVVTALRNNKITAGCIITDGILSGSNEEIRESPKRSYNIVSRQTLYNKVRDILSQPGNRDISALIVRYTAGFNGIYYCYNNDQIPLKTKKKNNEIKRPFFAFIICKSDTLNHISSRLDRNKVTHEVLFGGGMPFNINLQPKGLRPDKNGKYGLKDGETAPVEFSANISVPPAYMKKTDYMTRNLKLYTLVGNSKKPFTQAVNITGVTDEYLYVSVEARNALKGRTVIAEISYEAPSWISQLSSDDDSKIANAMSGQQNLTFNLKYLLEAFTALNNGNLATRPDTISFRR